MVNLVNGLFNLVIEPLFALIQNDGDVDFIPVSTAFAIANALCLIQVFYNWWIRSDYISTKVENIKNSEKSPEISQI